jgi:hypothetical protein
MVWMRLCFLRYECTAVIDSRWVFLSLEAAMKLRPLSLRFEIPLRRLRATVARGGRLSLGGAGNWHKR